jgi:hypothetical protein
LQTLDVKTLQPVTRDWVVARVRELLASSGRTDREVIIGYTYRALAANVYGTDPPTASQLSAVRRAVARLVAQGEAWRHPERLWIAAPHGVIDLPPRRHLRRGRGRGRPVVALNPGGTIVHRVPTESDDAAREQWLRRHDDG